MATPGYKGCYRSESYALNLNLAGALGLTFLGISMVTLGRFKVSGWLLEFRVLGVWRFRVSGFRVRLGFRVPTRVAGSSV